jgi:porphobilinogen synthase
MAFPQKRMRRLRGSEVMRNLVRETRLDAGQLVYPLFVCPGTGVKKEIKSMPGNFQLSSDMLIEECRTALKAGVKSTLIFGIPEKKDATGSEGYSEKGVVQTAVRKIKETIPDIFVITDVCNCEYTDHGHCGPIKDGKVDNDLTLEILGKQALSHARAGADMVAPSDMMDGRVGYIRKVLDESGYANLPIMSYAAKFASAFYGPFREAAESAPKFGDRKSYQMDPANAREALEEVALDIEEGADIVMVKPALAYLDVIRRVREQYNVPVAAYNVSGEFSMVKAAAKAGWIDEKKIVMEIMTAIKRAGSDIIITYFAKDVARYLREEK